MRVRVRWATTEVHEAVIDLDPEQVPEDMADFDAGEELSSDALAEVEGNESYHHTRDRDYESWEVVE